MKRIILIAAIVLGTMSAFAQDESYNLNLHFDNGVDAVLKIEDVGSRSYITLITDEVAKIEILRWEKKDKMFIYYCGEITIYINAANMRFTISYDSTNLNGNFTVHQ
jgi:hypothetical protein